MNIYQILIQTIYAEIQIFLNVRFCPKPDPDRVFNVQIEDPDLR